MKPMKTCRDCALRDTSVAVPWCRVRDEQAARKRKACHYFSPSVEAMGKGRK